MREIKESLSDLGFSKSEQSVYLALIELGTASVSDIAKKAGMKRTTVYNILPKLMSEGLVQRTRSNGKICFLVEDVKALMRRENERKDVVEALLPRLAYLHRVMPYAPRVKHYEGLGGFKEIYSEIMTDLSGGGEYLSYAGTRHYLEYVPKDLNASFIKLRLKNKVRAKIIAGNSALAEELKRNASHESRRIKIVDDPLLDFAGEFVVYGNKVALISHRENFLGMVMESKEIADMHRSIFELLWNYLP